MTRKKGLEQQLAEQHEQLKQAMALIAVLQEPSTVQKYWDWCKPYIIPFVIGVIVGVLITNHLPLTTNHSTFERQAAIGGAAIPFPNASPLPSPLNSLPGDWIEESADTPFTRVSDETLPSNPQADNGQESSQGLYRIRLLRRR